MDPALHAKIYRRAADIVESLAEDGPENTMHPHEMGAYLHAASILRGVADDYAAVAEMNAPDYKRTIVASYEYE